MDLKLKKKFLSFFCNYFYTYINGETMEKFIIQYKSKVNGEDKVTFHEKISLTDPNRLDVMNVYTEHISGDKSKAMVFYDREEAEKVSALFSNSLHIGKVIKR